MDAIPAQLLIYGTRSSFCAEQSLNNWRRHETGYEDHHQSQKLSDQFGGSSGTGPLPGDFIVGQAASTNPAAATQAPSANAGSSKPRPDPLKPELVKEFVIAAHGDLEKTKSMLAETPSLLNATWDWGGGDFEMAIGGAGHMGRRDIALFLIGQGARFDLFVAAMLGRLDVVKPSSRHSLTWWSRRGRMAFR